MILDDLITLELPENRKALRYIRFLFASKLFLLAILLPVLITLVMESYGVGKNLVQVGSAPDWRVTPVFTYVWMGLFVSAHVLVVLWIFTALVAAFTSVLIPTGWLFCFVVGYACEITLVIPRIFLGSILDSLLCLQPKKLSHSSTRV